MQTETGHAPGSARHAGAATDRTPLADPRSASKGVASGLAAYLWWGFAPIYFKAVASVPALEVLAHRVFWALLLLLVLVRWTGRAAVARDALRSGRTRVTLLATTALIAVNWFTFIWAVAHGRLSEASLGYFINPLVNVLLGFIFLGERLRPWQKVSVALAVVGVGYRTLAVGSIPVVTVVLALSFGFYGLLRKTVRADAIVGLSVEAGLLAPLCLAYLIVRHATGLGHFGSCWQMNALLPLAGLITAVPLLLFTSAARRLPFTTIGFLQYLAPSLQFLLAVVAYGEPFTVVHLISFGLIWGALAIYSIDLVAAAQRRRAARPASA